MTPTPAGNGYYMLSDTGGVICFGDARFAGTTAGRHLPQPVVTIEAAPTGHRPSASRGLVADG